ncbi:hypothetical protein G7K_3779-t1 [Saitoella complicata NRRL Y-17804]|uniref:Uncharacterized protein n=1 Tax=Saitoella complicata (strain BCRC 22490 / CBS 7301 / JCM 7358 / NBRC 10748 / NRRL Y-17804) TaxID=698492 RepID=A0A0E9NJP7_SAICN|nr:hypothetical protein G7K_3779-t1 [Saitoella complicata NRRL Y-17804]
MLPRSIFVIYPVSLTPKSVAVGDSLTTWCVVLDSGSHVGDLGDCHVQHDNRISSHHTESSQSNFCRYPCWMSRSTSPCRTKNCEFFVNVITLKRHTHTLVHPNLPPPPFPIKNSPILRLNLPRIPQHPNINKQLPRRLQTPRQINIGPLSLIPRQQFIIPPSILTLLGTPIRASGFFYFDPLPAELCDSLGAEAVVGHQASLVSDSTEVVDQELTRGAGVLGRDEVGAGGGEEGVGVVCEGTDFADDGGDEGGLVGGEVVEGEGAF